MGFQYNFTCSSCKYAAQVPGTGDAGMESSTITILCEECAGLYDIVAAWHDPKKRQPKLRCPKSKNHKWRDWIDPDKCPKYGTVLEIEPGGPLVLWD